MGLRVIMYLISVGGQAEENIKDLSNTEVKCIDRSVIKSQWSQL